MNRRSVCKLFQLSNSGLLFSCSICTVQKTKMTKLWQGVEVRTYNLAVVILKIHDHDIFIMILGKLNFFFFFRPMFHGERVLDSLNIVISEMKKHFKPYI